MRLSHSIGTIASVLLAFVLMFESGTVLAVNRESGDSWTYQMYTELEVGEFPLDMFGNVTYEFKAKDSLAMGLTETSVNIIGVE